MNSSEVEGAESGQGKTLTQILELARTATAVPRLSPLEDEHLQSLKQDRAQRLKHARACFWLLSGQLAFLNILLVLLGLKFVEIPSTLFQCYLVGTFGEVVTIVVVITAYLFPKPQKSNPPREN